MLLHHTLHTHGLPILPLYYLMLVCFEADVLALPDEVGDSVAQVPRVHAGAEGLVGLLHRGAQLLQQAVDAPKLQSQTEDWQVREPLMQSH